MKTVLVIGSARSGNAVSRLLARKGYEVYLTDMGEITEKESLQKEGIQIFEGEHPEHLKECEYEFIVKNPGIPYFVPFVKFFVDRKDAIYTEIEVASWFAKKFKYGAITGTNGKTTTASMLYELLKYNAKAAVAGNIGVPLSELVLNHEHEELDVALELSNFQLLGCKTFKPNVSVVCNLSPDHLDYMGSIEKYYRSKMKIYENCDENDYFLRNIDDIEVMEYAKDMKCSVIDYSLTKKADLYIDNGQVFYHEIRLFEVSELKLAGKHNLSNAMVAACMAYLLGVGLKDIADGIAKFQSVEHRLEFVARKNGIDFYNDSKATNPEAVVPALEAFDSNIILLAGGSDKKLPFDKLKVYNDKVKRCFSFGETKQAFEGVFSHVSICDTLQQAFEGAIATAREGDVVLLSPACASYDQFTSYEERGEVFKKLVNQYLSEVK